VIFSGNLVTAVALLLIVLITIGILLTSDLVGISHAQSPLQAEIILSPHPDPADGATGIIPEVPRVIDLNSGDETTTLLGSFQAQLTYDGNCLNILDVRELGFSITALIIDNANGTTTFSGASPGRSRASCRTGSYFDPSDGK
jgi:hypothetical protein